MAGGYPFIFRSEYFPAFLGGRISTPARTESMETPNLSNSKFASETAILFAQAATISPPIPSHFLNMEAGITRMFFLILFFLVCCSTPHRELFVKLLEAEEEELAEGDGERAGQLGEAEGRRIAAEEEIEYELLAGGDAGDERTAVARESGGDDVVRGLGTSGKGLERGSDGSYCTHRRCQCDYGDKLKHQLGRLPRLTRSEEIAHLLAVMPRTRRDLIAARDQLFYCRSDPNHRFLLSQSQFPFR